MKPIYTTAPLIEPSGAEKKQAAFFRRYAPGGRGARGSVVSPSAVRGSDAYQKMRK